MTTKKQQKENDKMEARERLRDLLKDLKKRKTYRDGKPVNIPVLYTIIRHVARSGMSRSIDVIAIFGDGEHLNLSYWITNAMDLKIDQKNGGIIMKGSGMDMGFALVYNLARALYGDGYAIHQEWL